MDDYDDKEWAEEARKVRDQWRRVEGVQEMVVWFVLMMFFYRFDRGRCVGDGF